MVQLLYTLTLRNVPDISGKERVTVVLGLTDTELQRLEWSHTSVKLLKYTAVNTSSEIQTTQGHSHMSQLTRERIQKPKDSKMDFI